MIGALIYLQKRQPPVGSWQFGAVAGIAIGSIFHLLLLFANAVSTGPAAWDGGGDLTKAASIIGGNLWLTGAVLHAPLVLLAITLTRKLKDMICLSGFHKGDLFVLTVMVVTSVPSSYIGMRALTAVFQNWIVSAHG